MHTLFFHAAGSFNLNCWANHGKRAEYSLCSARFALLFTALLPAVMGSMLEWGWATGPARFRMYISGDTLIHGELREIPRRYPDIDLGLFHLGGMRLFGVLLTMDARQGVQALRLIRPKDAHYLEHGDTYTFEVAGQRERSLGG